MAAGNDDDDNEDGNGATGDGATGYDDDDNDGDDEDDGDSDDNGDDDGGGRRRQRGRWRRHAAFLSGGYDKGVVVEGVTRAAKKAGSLSSSPSSESWASTTATWPSFRGGGDKGIACEGVVRAAKKAGSLSSSPSSESPPAAPASAAPEAGVTWECHMCGLPNNPSKKQCSSCQG